MRAIFWPIPQNCTPLPPDVTPEEALFLPNLETAVNFMMDGRPMIGERVVVFGQGIVGLLTTALLAQHPLARLITLDRHPLRRSFSLMAGAHISLDPAEPGAHRSAPEELKSSDREGADLVYELSGSPEALEQSLAVTGFSGRIVIGSWYGRKKGPSQPRRPVPSQPHPADQQPGQHHRPGTDRPLDEIPAPGDGLVAAREGRSRSLRDAPLSVRAGSGRPLMWPSLGQDFPRGRCVQVISLTY